MNYFKSFRILKYYNKNAYKLYLLLVISIYFMFYVLLLKIYKGKRDRDTNTPKYKIKTFKINKVKGKINYKIRYRKP